MAVEDAVFAETCLDKHFDTQCVPEACPRCWKDTKFAYWSFLALTPFTGNVRMPYSRTEFAAKSHSNIIRHQHTKRKPTTPFFIWEGAHILYLWM